MFKRGLKYAFPLTIPILAGFIFLGISYGLLAESVNIPSFITILASFVIYGGSIQFAMVPLLIQAFAPLEAFLLSLIVNARHIFYGITLLSTYHEAPRWMRPFLIFWTTDETFSLVVKNNQPVATDEQGDFPMYWVHFATGILNYSYWAIGTILGVVLSQLIRFETNGIEFVLTALFMTIFIDQWVDASDHLPAISGLVISILALIIFGATHFMVPAMIAIIAFFLVIYSQGGAKS